MTNPLDDELETYRAKVRARLAADQAAWDRRAGEDRFNLSGRPPQGPRPAMTDDEVEAFAQAEREKALTFRASPRGAYLRAVRSLLESGGYEREAEAALGAYSRGFSLLSDVPSPREIGHAIKMLAPINVRDARDALAALGDILAAYPETEAARLPLPNRGA